MMESIGQRISTLLLMCFFFPGLLWAQEEGAKPRPNLFKRLLNLIDSTSVRGIDPNYIEIPEKPWAFVLRSNLSQSFVNLRSETHEASPMKIRIRTTSSLTTSVGAWIGYRGYGLGYSIDLSEEAKEFVATKGYDVQFGARPLKRAIQNYIEDGVSDLIVNGDLQPGATIHITLHENKNELAFS